MRRLALVAMTFGAVSMMLPGVADAQLRPVPQAEGPSRPTIEHIVVVVLENTTAEAVLDTHKSEAPFLNGLAQQGAQLDNMFGVDHASLPNYLAMISGHASTATTRADCFVFTCVYEPGQDETVADQLEARGLSWKAYVDGMASPCLHSEEGHVEKYRQGYATRHNPFVYFAAIVRNTDRCQSHDVPFAQLAKDTSANALPNLSFIVPDTCHDGHDCSLSTADGWVRDTIAPLLAQPIMQDHGMVVVTFDEAESSDQRGCCDNARGGRIATWLVGAGIAPQTHSAVPYTHYSLLRSIENTFGLPCLRHACDALTLAYGEEIYGGKPAVFSESKPLPSKSSKTKILLGVLVAAMVSIRIGFMVRIIRRRRARKAATKL